jgi:nitrate/nitrite-specific signal transduction histidine kinase
MFAGEMCYIFALFLSKLSIGLFFCRLAATTEKTLFADVLVYACFALGMISALLIGLRQEVIEPWLALGQSTVSDIQQGDKSCSAANIDVAAPLGCG